MKTIKRLFTRITAGAIALLGSAAACAADAPSAAKQAAGAHMKSGGSSMSMLLMLFLVVAFYFLLVRPQTKRAKEHKQLVEKVAPGDEVVTTAGILGRVKSMNDTYVVLSVGQTEITLQKNAVASVLPKGTMDSIK